MTLTRAAYTAASFLAMPFAALYLLWLAATARIACTGMNALGLHIMSTREGAC